MVFILQHEAKLASMKMIVHTPTQLFLFPWLVWLSSSVEASLLLLLVVTVLDILPQGPTHVTQCPNGQTDGRH